MSNLRMLLEADRLLVAGVGYDADTADLHNLVFSDQYRMTRIVEAGEFAFSADDSGQFNLVNQDFTEPPRFRYAIEYSTFANGGDSDDRNDLNQWESLCPVIVAASPWTDAQYNNQTGFRNNTYVYTRFDDPDWQIGFNNRCGAGTVYYEILEDIT